MRKSSIIRETKETKIQVSLDLDGVGNSKISTGIGFLDHMLTLFSFHGGFDLEVQCRGDLEIDTHHTVEDIGIALGQALKEALGDKMGINRYGTCYLPMDEALSRVVIDISGRSYLAYEVAMKRELIGTLATEEHREFFKAVADHGGMTLHIQLLYGENDHHKIESVYKGFGHCLKQAVEVRSNRLNSTKGVI